MNRYTYGLNNPITYSDPTGRYAMDADGGGGSAAPADCDNACQYAHLQQTGNLYDDPGDSYNDRFQNGDLDATTEVHEDADGNPVIVVYNAIGITSSLAGRTVTYRLGGTQTTTPSAGKPTSIGTVVSTDPLIPTGAISLANASAFGQSGSTKKSSNVGVNLVVHHRSLIKKMARLVGINASVIAKILMEENNFGGKMGAWSNNAEQVEQVVPGRDARLGISNMHRADADYLYDPQASRFSDDFIFRTLIPYLPKYVTGQSVGSLFPELEMKWSAFTLKEHRSVMYSSSANDQQLSIAFLALVLGTTNNGLNKVEQPDNPAVTRDEALILSRKVGGYAAIEAYAGNYDKYRFIVVKFTGYGDRGDIMKIGPGDRPDWLDRYDKYNPDPLLK